MVFAHNKESEHAQKCNLILCDNIRIGIVLSLNNKKFFFILDNYKSILNFDYKFFIKIISSNKMTLKKLLLSFNEKYNFDEIKNLKQLSVRRNINNKIIYKNALILGPKKRNKNIINFLKSNKITVFNSINPIKEEYLKKNKIEIIFSSGYAYKIPKKIVDLYKNKIFNLHATFLPWGKGIGTTFYSFLLDQPVGVSIHLIEQDFDTGDILVRKKIKPNVNDTTRTFYERLLREIDLLFFANFKFIFSNQYHLYAQREVLKKKQPYFSRLEFEKLFAKLPFGYDTFLYQLSLVSYIDKINKKFITKFLYEK